MSKFIAKIILFMIIPLILTVLVFADNTSNLNLPNTKINPGSFYYPVKRVLEKGWERLQFGETQKIEFYKSQLKVRLAELNYVVEKKLLSEVQTSSERFAYQAGILTEELVKQNKVADKENLIKEFAQFSPFLDRLRDVYPANSSFWMLIQHDINSLKILSELLK
ncbi:MAG: DUF5667 domain-containing protein [Candidatus Daviesbacteria bacterium]|nr:DUF5667 domain-containing protein [Candidatus Daviesbacteria bacterium]